MLTRMAGIHDFTHPTIDGTEQSLSAFAGKVLLVVNVASRCGLTPQYAALQRLYEEHASQGLEVLGFPCNQFKGQEPGSEDEIRAFCTANYGVTFPLFAKLEVNGEHHDLNYSYVFEGKMLPLKLDLYGFRTGEYVGKTIYGIVMFRDEDTMRFETQVGEPMADGTRPEKFDKSSVRLMKRAKS